MITLIVNDTELNFEHSLVSLSEWEAEYERPFFPSAVQKEDDKTEEELIRYFEYMYVGPREDRYLLQMLTKDHHLLLVQYMSKSRTGTTIREIQKGRGPRENITSELIYYWLVAFRIPFQPTETWHLNRLLTLVRVCSVKQAPEKKTRQTKANLAQDMRKINEQRRAQMGTRG